MVAAAALVVLALWPPAAGAMMLVPVTRADAGAVARTAVAGHALLLGRGPLPGSLVVVARRADIAARVRPWRILIVAAPAAACGTNPLPGETA